jgi:hypothetical protein
LHHGRDEDLRQSCHEPSPERRATLELTVVPLCALRSHLHHGFNRALRMIEKTLHRVSHPVAGAERAADPRIPRCRR